MLWSKNNTYFEIETDSFLFFTLNDLIPNLKNQIQVRDHLYLSNFFHQDSLPFINEAYGQQKIKKVLLPFSHFYSIMFIYIYTHTMTRLCS